MILRLLKTSIWQMEKYDWCLYTESFYGSRYLKCLEISYVMATWCSFFSVPNHLLIRSVMMSSYTPVEYFLQISRVKSCFISEREIIQNFFFEITEAESINRYWTLTNIDAIFFCHNYFELGRSGRRCRVSAPTIWWFSNLCLQLDHPESGFQKYKLHHNFRITGSGDFQIGQSVQFQQTGIWSWRKRSQWRTLLLMMQLMLQILMTQ